MLVVDALNFSSNFGFTARWWNIENPARLIREFVSAAKASEFQLFVIIDAGIESEEAQEKWRKRREDELRAQTKDVPACLSILVGDLFRDAGVTHVYYSPHDRDCDYCIAYVANSNKGSVLSNDADFFRYANRTYKVFNKFEIVDGRLFLTEKTTGLRNLGPSLKLPTEPTRLIVRNPGFATVRATGLYRRGVPTSLSMWTRNIHDMLGPMRWKVYALLGIEGQVFEEWPSRCIGDKLNIEWHQQIVQPDIDEIESRLAFVSDEQDALRKEFESIIEYFLIFSQCKLPVLPPDYELHNHKMAVILHIGELLVAVNPRVRLIDLYRSSPICQKLEAEVTDFTPVPSPCRNWKETGACSFGDKCFAKSGHFVCNCRRGEHCRFRHE